MANIEMQQGFSIELSDFRLERRGTHLGLPLYESLGGKIDAIAIVDRPAIERNMIAIDEEQMFMGPAMIPDLKIFRKTGIHGAEDCYWYFSKETIKHLITTYKGKIKSGH